MTIENIVLIIFVHIIVIIIAMLYLPFSLREGAGE